MVRIRVAPVLIGAALLAAGAGLSGCGGTKAALGMTKVTPDEFRVVTKAPLVVPPDYSLRPPAPGEPRPQELQPESAARLALIGARQGEQRDDGEKLLAYKAGADKADPLVRYVVDDEFGSIAHKDKSFADRVMFWRKDNPTGASTNPKLTEAENTSAPIDPAVEARQVKQLTGEKSVVIQRDKRKTAFIKLPGL